MSTADGVDAAMTAATQRATAANAALVAVLVPELLHQRVLISGLGARPDLNGMVGFVEAFVESTGRCRVRVGPEALGLKLTNLKVQAWYEGMEVPGEVYAHLLSAYKIRIDDAYAGVGIVRGPLKFQSIDQSYEFLSWCKPSTDMRLFLARGVVRGALPPWWNEEHTRNLMQARSLLDNPLTSVQNLASPEEPYDFLQLAADPADGLGVLVQLRAIGDALEGPPPWGVSDRGARDHIEMRPTLRRRDENGETATICHRCRGDAWELTARGCGPGAISCPYCDYQGACAGCGFGSAIERGKCTGCKRKPTLYLRVDSHEVGGGGGGEESYAQAGCELAARLSLPKLVCFAVGAYPRLCTAEAEAGERAKAGANTGDRLHESTEPALLALLEAGALFQAGAAIVARSLGLEGGQVGWREGGAEGLAEELGGLGGGAGLPEAAMRRWTDRATEWVEADPLRLVEFKAGIQLLCDAYFTDRRCVPLDTSSAVVLLVAIAEGVIDRQGHAGPNGGRVLGSFTSTASYFMCAKLARQP